MITNFNKIHPMICGIYKLNYSNGKVYIGQAINIRNRASEHNTKNIQLCDKALKKYEAVLEILEELPPNELLLEEREKFWISYYQATDREKGYNILEGGNASGKRGTENCNASLTEDSLNKVIDLLINHLELSYIDIANMFGISQCTVYKIATGKTYFNKNLNYPLRPNNHEFAKKTMLDYFNDEEELINLKEDLLYGWDLNIDVDLVQKYKIPVRIIRDINQGRLFKEYGTYSYPIREFNKTRNINELDKQKVLEILDKLKNTKKTMEQIGKEYGMGRAAIRKLNLGETYPIKNYEYPARLTK